VLNSLIEPLHSKNYHVLRYNSRGVGGSSGWPSLTGLAEGKDLEEVVHWAVSGNLNIPDITGVVIIVRCLNLPPYIWRFTQKTLQGYSHGSLIASSCPPNIAALRISHVLISYPLGPRSWLTMFHSSTYATCLKDLTSHPESNVLIAHGDQDEFTSKITYEKWVLDIRSPHTRVIQVPGGSHFWRGTDGDRLIDEIQTWLS